MASAGELYGAIQKQPLDSPNFYLADWYEPGSPWENGYIESFNGKMRDELLAREIFYSLKEAQVMIEMWRQQYNTIRLHSALGYRPPAPVAITLYPSQFQQVGLA